MPGRYHKIQDLSWWLFALAWFAVWHLIVTFDVWRDPLHRVPGPLGDNAVMVWNIGWVRYAFQHGSPGFWFKNAYYPDGFLFLYGTPTWLDGFFCWLASPLLPADYTGAIIWANITMLLATVASGLAIISGLRAWGVRNWPVLLLISSAAAFSWFRIYAMTGHYHFSGTQWMLLSLCVLSWARAAILRGETLLFLRRCAAAGLLLGISYLNDQALAVFAAVLAILVFSSLVRVNLRRALSGLGLLIACSFGVSLLHLVPTAMALATGKVSYEVDPAPRLVDASSLVLPPDWHYLGSYLRPLRQAYGLAWAEGTYLGAIPILLLIATSTWSVTYLLGTVRRRPGLGPTKEAHIIAWSCAASWVFVICALGDRFMVGPHQIVTFPGRLLREIPVINNIRLPQRWIWPAQLCIALSGGMLLCRWFSSAESRRPTIAWSPVLILACAIVPPLEGYRYPAIPPVDFLRDPYVRPPGLVEEVRASYRGGSILMMPAEKAYGHANILQFLLGYEFPMAITYTARMPFKPAELPWNSANWTPGAGEWLRQRDVRMLVFPFEEGSAPEYREWVRHAKEVIPGIIALDRDGSLL